MGTPNSKEFQGTHGPYLTARQAATFCGYSYDHFRHLITEYDIPRCGPAKNRFSQLDLDTWMQNPIQFKIRAFTNRKRLKKLEV